jgi:hypothetical protein
MTYSVPRIRAFFCVCSGFYEEPPEVGKVRLRSGGSVSKSSNFPVRKHSVDFLPSCASVRLLIVVPSDADGRTRISVVY